MFQFSPLSIPVSMFNLAAQLPADGAIIGTEGADTLTGTAADDEIWGYGGNDRIIGGFGADYLYGGAGNDWFGFSAISSASGSRIGLIDGGDGIDTLNLSTVSPIVVGTIQLDNGDYSLGVYVGGQKFAITNVERIVLNDLDNGFYWTNFTDQPVSVFGGAGNDYLNGSPNLSLHGEVGDDIFFVSGTFGGTARAGAVYGGAGIDTLQTNISFTVDLAAGTATSGTASYTISSIEIVEVVPAPAYPSIVYGSDAAETFRINPTFADRTGTVTFHGRGGDDVLEGGLGDDLLDGGDGADRMDGGGGADRMVGGAGNDVYIVDNVGDHVVEANEVGQDIVNASVSYSIAGQFVETLNLTGNRDIDGTGNGLNNMIRGNDGHNRLSGGSGHDILNGGRGGDIMDGGQGDDIYHVDDRADRVIEAINSGNDTINSSISYVLVGTHVENLILTGTAIVHGTGNHLDNRLTGNGRGNVLNAGAGDDLLRGGLGSDRLIGGAGDDVFWFDTAPGALNIDRIDDFNVSEDSIRLSPTIFANVGPNGRLAEAAFAIGSVADQADDRILYDSVSGALFYDADGNGGGVAIQFSSITPGLALSYADFVIG